jgi:hypothetical protein
MIMRVAMALLVILGIGFWTGHWRGLVNLHMMIGILFVLCLWIISGAAIAQKKQTGLAAFGLLWGLVIVALGMTQTRLLVGDLHWIVRVLHLAVGIAALPIAERLGSAGRT